MHTLDEHESLTVSAALMFYVAAHDALASIHGKAPLSEEERDELMRISERLSMPRMTIEDAAKAAREDLWGRP